MLTLRRGTVISVGDSPAPMQELVVRVGDEDRPAIADVALVGISEVGDDVVVNVAALDLALGSGGFDIVHVNLSRGLDRPGESGAHVMKLNYTSLQHAVHPIEPPLAADGPAPAPRLDAAPVGVFLLHGQLAPLAWAFDRASRGARLGYVQTGGAALPGRMSTVVQLLREHELLAGHVTAGAAYGGSEGEAISTAGALHAGFTELGWDAAVVGPGPGILGSATALGHGGLVALDSAHTAAALGCRVVVAPRRSSGDPRPRHRGLSHHARTLLELALVPLIVAGEVPEHGLERHDWRHGLADLDGYVASGLPARTMGRSLEEDPEFFAAALSAGSVLGSLTA